MLALGHRFGHSADRLNAVCAAPSGARFLEIFPWIVRFQAQPISLSAPSAAHAALPAVPFCR
jgi:hypothetical protein